MMITWVKGWQWRMEKYTRFARDSSCFFSSCLFWCKKLFSPMDINTKIRIRVNRQDTIFNTWLKRESKFVWKCRPRVNRQPWEHYSSIVSIIIITIIPGSSLLDMNLLLSLLYFLFYSSSIPLHPSNKTGPGTQWEVFQVQLQEELLFRENYCLFFPSSSSSPKWWFSQSFVGDVNSREVSIKY